VKKLLNSYVASPVFAGELDDFIVPPALGKRSGVLGALAMAKILAKE
jgi:fructokinase